MSKWRRLTALCRRVRTLAAMRIDDADLVRPLAVLYKKNKVLSTAMKQFIALLKED